jgi:hypothetical protein
MHGGRVVAVFVKRQRGPRSTGRVVDVVRRMFGDAELEVLIDVFPVG